MEAVQHGIFAHLLWCDLLAGKSNRLLLVVRKNDVASSEYETYYVTHWKHMKNDTWIPTTTRTLSNWLVKLE